jgi:hypothetical protein
MSEGARMESYPVDLDPAQVVRWVRVEHQRWPSAFRITAMRSQEMRDIPVRQDLHLGDEEREDLNEIAILATLEIAPAHAADGWLLRIVVEDEIGPREIGPRLTEGETAGVAEHEIDLGAFYREFIRPGRGNATITGEADSPQARHRLTRLLDRIAHVQASSL